MLLTARDRELVEWIGRFGAVEAEQAMAWFRMGRTAAYRRASDARLARRPAGHPRVCASEFLNDLVAGTQRHEVPVRVSDERDPQSGLGRAAKQTSGLGRGLRASGRRADATSMTRAISGVFLILWAAALVVSGLVRGVASDGGAFGVGQVVGFVLFPMLLVWLGRRAVIKGLAARRLS